MQQDNETVASRFIRYGISQASERKNRELLELPNQEFFRIPAGDRDIVWHAHCIKRVPAYRLDDSVAAAVTKLVDNHYTDPERAKKFNRALEDNPRLYAVPFPVMWIEWGQPKGTPGSDLSNGLLIESLPSAGTDGVPDVTKGIKSTLFAWSSEQGVFPNSSTPILSGIGTPTEFQTMRAFIKGSPRFNVDEKFMRETKELANGAFVFSTCTLAVLKSRILQLVLPEEASTKQKRIARRALREGNFAKGVQKPLGRLTFDISRVLSQGGAKDENEAKEILHEHIVTGHFKLIEMRKRDESGNKLEGYESDLVWWSPHWRGGTEDERAAHRGQLPLMNREANAVVKSPDRPRVVPWLEALPKDFSRR